MAIGDLNGDTAPDMVLTNEYGRVSVLLGIGDGTFSYGRSYSVGSSTIGVAVEDLNDDQVLDMAVAVYGDDSIAVLLGVGDGTFSTAQFYAAGDKPTVMAIADLSGD